MKNFFSILLLVATLGCGDSHNHEHPAHNHGKVDAHGHKAPHGGVLVNVENEFCHLEFVQEPGAKRLQMHVMRFHPKEGPVKFYAEKVEATIRAHAGFMRANHSLDDSKIQLIHYYVSKA